MWKVEHKKAVANGKGSKFPAFNPEDLGPPRVNIDKLCPETMTAKHFGRMYTVEFVEAVIVRGHLRSTLTRADTLLRRQRSRGRCEAPAWTH